VHLVISTEFIVTPKLYVQINERVMEIATVYLERSSLDSKAPTF